MKRRVLRTVVLVLASMVSVACGDDADGETAPKAGTSGGTAGRPDNGGGKITCDPGKIACGLECCGAAPGVMAEPCCADDITGQCGMLGGFGMTRACVKAIEPHETCPSVQLFPGFVLASCCTAGMCGINASIFNQSGCTELGAAAQMAEDMINAMQPQPTPTAGTTGGDEDGGVAGTTGGGAAGRFGGMMFPRPMFPPPQACTE